MDNLPGFNKILVQGGSFLITTYQKIDDPKQNYVFYIEGDGNVGGSPYSLNPTPRSEIFTSLVALDKRPNVIYVARPCQYTDMQLNPTCHHSYWGSKRFSDDSIAAMNAVITTIAKGKNFSLIGYSGGGGVAVLIAVRNNQVQDIITIAGNLDHEAFSKYHHSAPMSLSLNPIDYVNQVKHIPQLHLSGAKDRIVPPFIAEKFVKAAGSTCVKQKLIPDATHSTGWEKIWNGILAQPLNCLNY